LTDEQGRFELNVPSGNYELDAESPGFLHLIQNVDVNHDVRRFLRPRHLHVLLGLGGLDCSFATTSTRDFKYEIERFKLRTKPAN